MEYTYHVQLKLRGDGFCDGFSNGLTLTGSASVAELRQISSSATCDVYTNARGHRVTCWHIPQPNGAVVCYTEFENAGSEPATLELLSSFALEGVHGDRMHRMASFWSAEGRLLSQDLVELDMEPSWSEYGVRVEKFGQVGSMPVRKWFPFLAV